MDATSPNDPLEQLRRNISVRKKPLWLAIEDAWEDRYLLLDVMQPFEPEVLFAGCFKDAKMMVAKQDFSLCLFDLKLPDVVSPVDAIEELKAIQPTMAIAVLTGASVTESLAQVLGISGMTILTKPLTADQVRRILAPPQ